MPSKLQLSSCPQPTLQTAGQMQLSANVQIYKPLFSWVHSLAVEVIAKHPNLQAARCLDAFLAAVEVVAKRCCLLSTPYKLRLKFDERQNLQKAGLFCALQAASEKTL